jgi:hypothetical protein
MKENIENTQLGGAFTMASDGVWTGAAPRRSGLQEYTKVGSAEGTRISSTRFKSNCSDHPSLYAIMVIPLFSVTSATAQNIKHRRNPDLDVSLFATKNGRVMCSPINLPNLDTTLLRPKMVTYHHQHNPSIEEGPKYRARASGTLSALSENSVEGFLQDPARVSSGRASRFQKQE